MKLPISWLKKYVEVDLSPEKLAEALTMSGTAVDRIERVDGEAVLEIEITTNRPDCLSILGLAREVAAISGKKINFPKISDRESPQKAASFKVKIEDKKGCPRYTARLIEGVAVKPSPEDAARLIQAAGSRPIHNIVDATNFVLLEMGQPLHAFDADKIKGRRILVRRAFKNEKFLGIDGVEYTLGEETLVIADRSRAIAIAGVMGGKLTEVDLGTKNILLEAAYFDPVLVRQAARRHKISTESSHRFERGVDSQNVLPASARARDLILDWAGGKETGRVIVQGASVSPKQKSILLTFARLEKILGLKIAPSRISKILKSLGFSVKPDRRDGFWVQPSAFRRDIVLEADLIEEVLRIEGFDKVPAKIPVTRHMLNPSHGTKAADILSIKEYFSALGFSEITSLSLLSEAKLLNSGFEDLKRAQKIRNPLSLDQAYLRPTLLAGMLEALSFNVRRKVSGLKLFEIGNRLVDGCEQTTLALGLYGTLSDSWQGRKGASFFDLKGLVENFITHLKLKSYEFEEQPLCPQYEASGALKIQGKKVGSLGLVNTKVLGVWDIAHEVFFAELDLDGILDPFMRGSGLRVRPVPKFPSVRRDIAFLIDETVPVRALEDLMREVASPHLSRVHLFDQYIGKNVPLGKRSLAFSLEYQKETATFTDDEIRALQEKVSDALKTKYAVELRS